jgi:C4-dicarboxylate-specific signal transduction histidine kinase
LWALLFSLFFAGIILFGYNLWSAQRELWEGAKATAQMQVELIETHLDATLRRVDATLIDLVDRLPMDALERDAVAVRRQALESDMQSYLHVFPEVAGFRVIDARGDVLYISGGGEYVNLLDRDYVKALQRTKDDTIVFSDVVMSRITGRPTLVAARAIRAADGSFRGAVSAAIELTHFSRLFQSVRSGGKGVLVIRRRNNHVADRRFRLAARLASQCRIRWLNRSAVVSQKVPSTCLRRMACGESAPSGYWPVIRSTWSPGWPGTM